jgi:ligand-binding sensor domain-containing protein
VGTGLGEIYRLEGHKLQAVEPPPGLTVSGVFCVRDMADGGLWLANRSFVGRRTTNGWQRIEHHRYTVARRGRHGSSPRRVVGLRQRTLAPLSRGRNDHGVGTPLIDQPREIFEDRQGRLWLVSSTAGLTIIQPDGSLTQLRATNGLTHNSALMVLQDREDLPGCSSVGGLQRLRERDFKTLSTEEGLPDRIVKTVTTAGNGNMLLGTHGGCGAPADNAAVPARVCQRRSAVALRSERVLR